MTHTEREWRDGQPEDAGLAESTGPDGPVPLAGQVHEDDPLVEHAAGGDPLVEHAAGSDPLVERVGEDDPLVEHAAADDPLVQSVRDDDPLVERAAGADPLMARAVGEGPLVEEVHEQAGLGSAGDQERFVARWQEIQAGFVDEPRRAVQDADALVVDMMDRLARMLASERDQLESAGQTGKVSTEDLRLGLRRYRALFERLLAV
jgi:hypothetical protein